MTPIVDPVTSWLLTGFELRMKTREAQDARKGKSSKKRFKRPEGMSDREFKKEKYLRGTYKLTLPEWKAMFKAQGSRCAICQAKKPGSPSGWHTDHCHFSNKVRAILCCHCNRMMGACRDNLAILTAASQYLLKHQDDAAAVLSAENYRRALRNAN